MYHRTKYKKNHSRKKLALLFLLFIIFIVIVSALFFIFKSSSPKENTSQATDSHIDLSPPSDKDKQETEKNKENIAKQLDGQEKTSESAPSTALTSDGKKKGEVVIASSSQDDETVRIAAYVSNVFEEGGTCTIALTKGAATITRETKGFQNASYTQCMPFQIPRSDFPTTGIWNIEVSYDSPSTTGESSVAQMEVK